jgi:hypothetical protein
MAALKARLGDPRPEGMTLSLVNSDSPHVYDGCQGERQDYRLSTNPADYQWETLLMNNRRKVA